MRLEVKYDFRGISISCVMSNVFEHRVLDRFGTFLATTDSQFGFKKATGCSHMPSILRVLL